MKLLKRWAIILVGFLITGVGLVLMPLPGPGGTPVTLAGLAVLAVELPWARKFISKIVSLLLLAKDKPWKRVALLVGVILFWIVSSFIGWELLAGLKLFKHA